MGVGASQLLCVGAFAAQTAITYLSQAGVFGKTNKDVSDKYFSLTTPAGYAFAIWGAIFTWEGVFVVGQCLRSTLTPELLGWWLSANVFQSLWTFAFAQEQITLSAVMLTGIAASMLGCVFSAKDQSILYVSGPLALHAGWVTVAALLNWNLVLVSNDVPIQAQALAAYGTIGAATLAGAAMLYYEESVPYAFSIAWALLAVNFSQAKQGKVPIDRSTRANITYGALSSSCIVAAGIAGVVAKQLFMGNK
mmetsp:Transcript_33302/g.61916  ORF Transcript_33302/g.61916 Transcript_33302/m.61916 type:complete len:250 (-) Transcript_33302:228-977(-)